MRKTKTVEVADLRTLTHQELLNILKDATNTVELRKQLVRLLQDRSHRPLGFAYASDREIEIALETLAPFQKSACAGGGNS